MNGEGHHGHGCRAEVLCVPPDFRQSSSPDGAVGSLIQSPDCSRAAPGRRQCGAQGFGKAGFFVRAQKHRDGHAAALRDQIEPFDAELLMRDLVEPDPERVEHPFHDMAAMADPAQPQFGRRHRDLFIGPRAAEIDLEGPIDRQHVEAEKAEHRPGAHHQERDAGGKTDRADNSTSPPESRCG